MNTFVQPLELDNAGALRASCSAALTLNEYGIIGDCCKDGEGFFGYRRSELQLKHVSLLLPQLAEVPLIRDGSFNPRLDFLCHCGHRFVVQSKDGSCFYAELHFVHLQYRERSIIRLMLRSSNEDPFESRLSMPAAAVSEGE